MVVLISFGLPSNMRGEALYSACQIFIRVPYKFFEKTPYELWRKKEQNLKYLKVWGCLANVNIPINKKRKMRPKIVDYLFVRYSLYNTTYRFLVVNLEVFEISNGTIMKSSDVTFFENVFPWKNKLSKSVCDTSCSNLSSCSNVNKDNIFEPRRSKRSKNLRILVLNFALFYLKMILKLMVRP